MLKRLLVFLCLLPLTASATTTVTGTLNNLGTGTVSSGTYVRVWLRGCSGNQPRINGTALIVPSSGGQFYFDFTPVAGVISGTLYSTRDAAGTGNGDIQCGDSYTSVYYGVQVFVGGKGGPETPVHAKSGATLDLTNVTPITTVPVETSPSGDTTYARIDGGNMPFTTAISAPQVSSKKINNVRYADQFSGSDIGAKINNAFTDCAGVYCTVVVSPGTYSYSTDIYFSLPSRLKCEAGAILNYTGSGKAAKMGPDGLTVANYQSGLYVVEGCEFTGGASMTHGIYFNGFVVNTYLLDVKLDDFGNSSAWNVFYQYSNWYNVIDKLWLHTNTSHVGGLNGIRVNGLAVDGVTTDSGNSRLLISNSILQPFSTDGSIAVYLNGAHSVLSKSTISSWRKANMQVGAWCSACEFDTVNNEISSNTVTNPSIFLIGDETGAYVGRNIDGLTINKVFANLHNTLFAGDRFATMASNSQTITNVRATNNQIADMANSTQLFTMNNLANQSGNYANFNIRTPTNSFAGGNAPIAQVHNTGALITPWGGKEDLSGFDYVYNAYDPTSAANYERGGCYWSSNVYSCGSFAGGTGTGRNHFTYSAGGFWGVFLGATPVEYLEVSTAALYPFVDGGLNLGVSGVANRFGTAYLKDGLNVANGAAAIDQNGKGTFTLSATATNCASAASPAVCAAAAAGRAVVAAAATTVVVNTTAVTANSEIKLQRDNSLGTALSVTCNTQSSLVLGTPYVSARTAGTSFTVTLDVAPTTNPLCFSYSIVN